MCSIGRSVRKSARASGRQAARTAAAPQLSVTENGLARPLDLERIRRLVENACQGLGAEVRAQPILEAMQRDLYEGVPMDEVRKSLILAARALIEQDPGYSYVTARLLLNSLRLETLGEEVTQAQMATRYAEYLPRFVEAGIEAELLDERLATYDLKLSRRGARCEPRPQVHLSRLQILYDRYFLHIKAGVSSCRRSSSCVWRWGSR
jgi:ribonucleoside-diphosphate reductase alpha chain